jgi:hypothetical protein
MFVNNVRRAIRELDENEYNQFVNEIVLLYKKIYSKSKRPSYFDGRIQHFLEPNEINTHYFDLFLMALNNIHYEGAIEALMRGKKKIPATWRDLIITATSDTTLPYDIRIAMEDHVVLVEVKAVFKNSLEFCKAEEKGKILSNLRSMNQFLNIHIN